jgi:Zn-dependent protease
MSKLPRVSFRLLGIPVEVQGGFLITALLFAFMQRSPTLPGVLASMVIIFLAVMVHELGHALAGRAFGVDPRIVLHGFGGRTIAEGKALSRGKNILMTLAGPGAGFLLGLVALGIERAYPPSGIWKSILLQIEFCTFGWGILNLMPVLPLDGGLVMRDVLGPRHGRLVLMLSALFGAILTVFFLKLNLIFAGIIFGLSTYQSARGAMSYGDFEAERKAREETAQQRLAMAQRSLEAGRLADAVLRAGEAMMLTAEPRVRDGARRIAASASIGESNGQRALEILEHLEEPTPDDDVLRAQALDVAGEREAGFSLLRSKVDEDPSGPALEALLRGLVATEQVPQALTLAQALELRGSVEALAWFAGELRQLGEREQGARLFEALFRRTGEERFEREALQARTEAEG